MRPEAAKPAMTSNTLIARYQHIRQTTLAICNPLALEDFVVQPTSEVSPPKWHLGHTTWFFEAVIAKRFDPHYVDYDATFHTLFNSYYKAAGTHTLQAERGTLSRPTVDAIMRYRTHVDQAIIALLNQPAISDEVRTLVETGLHHEQQHQELLYMDIKYILASNLLPTQYSSTALPPAHIPATTWVDFAEGLVDIGADTSGFAYDNERPRHRHYLYPFAIAQHLVSNGEFLAFLQDDGYRKAEYWLSQGWDWVNTQQIQHPLYWRMIDGKWHEYTLHGLVPLDASRPVVHISYFEAYAFAHWKGCRLPTEQELEVFLNTSTTEAQTNASLLQPTDVRATTGQVWCWTSSQYNAYPRFKAFDGLLNEYNGKFMCNQFVLRGGCVVTPLHHYRHSYRNFYLPQQRWMFAGIRLAKDIV